MKIIVSSKVFYHMVKRINTDNVMSVKIDRVKKFTIYYGHNYSLTFPVETNDNGFMIQDNVRWDWLLKDIKGIQEQPICIEFTVNKASFTLSY